MLFRKKISKSKPELKYSAEMFAVLENDTAETALEVIRSSKLSGNIFYCYVTDNKDKLVGIVPLRKLITSSGETKISEIMMRNPIRLTTQCTTDIALEYFILYKFLAFRLLIVMINSLVLQGLMILLKIHWTWKKKQNERVMTSLASSVSNWKNSENPRSSKVPFSASPIYFLTF
jgi:predicted transcriptional regulator